MAKQVTYDRSLYLPEAVEAAAAAYAGHAEIQLTSTGEAVVASIAGIGDADVETVAHAFSNHVLHETIVRLRQAPEPETR